MASNTPKPELTPEERAYWESLLALAEPYAEDDPILDLFDGELDHDRMAATIAKRALEGKL